MIRFSLEHYQALRQGLQDIYWQELRRAPDEGGWVNWFWHMVEDGRDFEWVRARIVESEEWQIIHSTPAPPASRELPRLTPSGHVFTQNGQPFTVIEASDFNLFTTYLMLGEDRTRELMQQRSEIGFNMLRVWLAYWDTNTNQGIPEIGKLNPAEFPGMYARLKPFCELAASYGLYIEFTAFTGPHIDGHWEQIGANLQGVTNALLELANENNAHAVRIDPNRYQKHPGILCSHGSNASQNLPPRPAWDYEVMHFVNVPQWPRKVGHNSMEIHTGDPEGNIAPGRVPVIANENTRPDQDGNVQHFHDAAAGAALLAAGACFHSQSGKASVLVEGRDLEFAKAWVAGARSVPLGCQRGPYRHRADLESPAWPQGERVYQRGFEDGCIVRIRA
jgi:hypothetical protein